MILILIQAYLFCMLADLAYTYYIMYTTELPDHLQSAVEAAREDPNQWLVMHGSIFIANLLLSATWPKTANDAFNRKLNEWRGLV